MSSFTGSPETKPNQDLSARLQNASTAFASDRKGSVAIIFATALVPIIAVVGIAVDYSRASNVRVQLQTAVDAAAMAGAVNKVRTSTARRTAAENSFDANTLNIKHGATVTKTATPSSTAINVVGTATVQTAFMKLVGTHSITMTANSTVHYGGKNLELAIVLDTTGSMNYNNKLVELKAAVPTILDIVMPTGATNSRVALVPFAEYVNVGSTNTALLSGRTDWPNARCVLERKRGTRPNESAPDLYSDEFWIKTSNSSCSSTKPITPLTSSRTTLDTAMQNLTASGGTSGHLGIQWGWHAISPEWIGRWPSASSPVGYTDDTTLKAIVVLTDGNLTELHRKQNGYSANCNGRDDCAESREEARNYCDAIKTKLNSQGEEAVMIFTIGFGLEPESSSAGQKSRHTMKYCASYDKNDPETDLTLKKKHFYFPVTQADLEAAFASIGTALTDAVNKPRFTN